ncbi:MAG: hypothetical protein ACUVT3_00715 [Ignavibacterium sp.]
MGSKIDKNDVDISRLFYYRDKFELETSSGEKIPIYMRVIGDAELNQARVFALRESRKFRKNLHLEDSDEALAYLPDLDSLTKEELIKSIILSESNEIIREANNQVTINLPLEPKSTASLKEQEEYQEKVDNFDDEYNRLLTGKIEEITRNEEARLQRLDEEQLRQEAFNRMINQLCELRMLDRFQAMCTYFATYKDENYKERMFENFDQFDNLPKEVKEQLVRFYNKLEIDEATLKKSHVPSQ